MLCNIKYAHDDVPSVGDYQGGSKSLEYPLEKGEGFKIVKAVLVNHHLDQLICHNKGQNDASDRDDDIFGQVFDHIENAAVPALRGGTNLTGYLADFLIDT